MISRAIERAYRVARERNWDRIYWALDLHGTCIESNYKSGDINWINNYCEPVLQWISRLPETRLILWSSMYQNDKDDVCAFFRDRNITTHGFNCNPYEPNTKTGFFDEKFYMSIIVDDKAGFHPNEWIDVIDTVSECRKKYGFE